MTDIKINLLPWREERREEKKRDFLNVLVGVVVFAGAIVFAIDRYYNNAIDHQNNRNQFITKEVTILEKKIEEIQSLQAERSQLLSRRKVIEELQGNRPIIVRLFDELARQMGEDVFFSTVKLVKKELKIEGVAESNNKIARQLRNYTKSEWFEKPNVTAISADSTYGPEASKFELTVSQATPTVEGSN